MVLNFVGVCLGRAVSLFFGFLLIFYDFVTVLLNSTLLFSASDYVKRNFRRRSSDLCPQRARKRRRSDLCPQRARKRRGRISGKERGVVSEISAPGGARERGGGV